MVETGSNGQLCNIDVMLSEAVALVNQTESVSDMRNLIEDPVVSDLLGFELLGDFSTIDEDSQMAVAKALIAEYDVDRPVESAALIAKAFQSEVNRQVQLGQLIDRIQEADDPRTIREMIEQRDVAAILQLDVTDAYYGMKEETKRHVANRLAGACIGDSVQDMVNQIRTAFHRDCETESR
ncbi:hypothetical protein [Salisediminibacterium beveridgei]|nr:hypothetical protein [Salisediminibacterium beveridgei]